MKSIKRIERLNEQPDNYNQQGAVVILKDETGNLTFGEEPIIKGSPDDFKAQNLLDIGAKFNPLPVFKDSEKISIKNNVEKFAKQTLEKINNINKEEV